MQRTLNEPIRILVEFRPIEPAGRRRGTLAIPRVFLWRNRRYLVTSLNLIHTERQGEATVYYFSVSAEGTTYTLSFHNVRLEWHLVHVWEEAV